MCHRYQQCAVCILQPLHFVFLLDYLAVLGALQHPPLLLSSYPYGRWTDSDYMLGKLFLDLAACCSIIFAHLSASPWKLLHLQKALIAAPNNLKFATEPVSFSFLIICVTLANLASKLSFFNDLHVNNFGWMKILLVKKAQFEFAYNM